MENSTARLWRANRIRSWAAPKCDLQATGSRQLVADVWTGLADSLRVINRIHTQLQLRLVRLPALRADQNTDLFGLDREFAQLLEHVPLGATVALRNRVLG